MKCTVCKETDEFFAALCTREDCPHEVENQHKSVESELVEGDTPTEVLEQFAAEDKQGRQGWDDLALEDEEIFPQSSSNRKLKLPNGKTIVLNDQQEEALELGVQWLQDREALFYTLSGYAGTGKMQPDTEPILTPEGWKTMGDIEIGSAVSCPITGDVNFVSKVFKHEDLNIYKVTFSDGTWTECCEDHLWRVQTSKQKTKGTFKVKTLKELLTDYNHKNSSKGWRYSIPCPAAIKFAFDGVTLPLDPYLLGWLLGDGYLSPNTGGDKAAITISVNSYDVIEIFETLKKCLPEGAYIEKKPQYATSGNVTQLKVYGIVSQLKELGLWKARSREKFIPQVYLLSSVKNRKLLLAGLMDTDGSVTTIGTKKKLRFSSFSKALAKGVSEIVRSLGCMAHSSTNIRDKYEPGTIDTTVSLKLDFNPFLRLYKNEDYGDYQGKFSMRKSIILIKYVGKKDGRCIVVESNDHLYITRDYTVTHNSTIAKEIIKEAVNRHLGSIAVSAPTHKAKKVISNATKLEGETIQSLLGLSPNTELADFDINKPEFAPKKKPTIEYYRMIVVDEASMLNKDLWEMLKEQARRFNCRLLLMGDSAQLPPVKEDKSMAFLDPDITYKFELSIVERQKDGNPLLVMYDLIRNNLHKEHDQFHKENTVHIVVRPDYSGAEDPRNPQVAVGHRFINTLNEFGLQVVEAFRSDDFQLDPNFCKVLCWTNTQVEFWNKSIRKTLIADLARNKKATEEQLLHATVMIPNELLMSYSTYTDSLQNSGEYEVISMQFTEKKIHWGDTKQYSTMIQGYRVALLDIDQDTILNTFIVDPDTDNITAFTRVFNSYLFLAKTKKAWPAYFAFKGENLLMKEIRDAAGQLVCKKDLDYAYALTCHKSQGSTYDNVFVDMQDINKNKNWVERNKLKYVALSRPRYLATIYTGGIT